MINNNKKKGHYTGNTVRLIVFNGESNSGGAAANSFLNTTEAATRTNVKILNNTTLTTFDNLIIGTNNLIGHAGIANGTLHGWENELANQADAGIIDQPTYLVKTGQGGSLIADWNTGGPYYNTMKARVDAALSLLSGSTVKMFWFYSQGINDALQPTPTNTTTWQNATAAYFAQIRTLYGATVPIIMTKFNGSMPSNYNANMDALAASNQYNYALDCTGATIIPSGPYGLNHWDYEGYKFVANKMIQAMLTFYP